ncbi:hypothetical protein BMETH_1544_0 [methanotrophic bacterial endosymbiont of Bathymodiolus sp.]|nr:hypothetical protein BMETH_1544_0 [methanotrophic bacterial endosymbiont of Bathymodiolus sp.]
MGKTFEPFLRSVINEKHPHGRGEDWAEQGNGLAKEKHPHGRGEDITQPIRVAIHPETPPRAWGRQVRTKGFWQVSRNTPTGVGKTKPHA